MIRVSNITADPHQRHTLLTDDGQITLELRFLPAVQIWVMDTEYKGKVSKGVKLSAAVHHLRGFNYPFDFTIALTDGSDIDPFRRDDFETGRCELYYITPAEMEQVRGLEVPT